MENKHKVKERFGRSANAYVESHIHRSGDDLQLLINMAQFQGEEKLLDVATGGGHTANAFAPFVKQVIALDLTPEMLIAAEKFIKSNGYENVKFVEGDAENMPFPDTSFDIVTSRIAPHHFPQVKDFIREVHRVLKPGGQFLLDDNVAPEDDELDEFYNTFEKMRDNSHDRAWKKTEWVRKIELQGFEIEALYRFVKQFHFEDWCNRMNLSDKEKETLNKFMVNAIEKAKRKFNIQIIDNQVESFYGEAVLLKAMKI